MCLAPYAPSDRDPARACEAVRRRDDALDPAYASDLEELTQGPGAPELWLHGHIHASQDYVVGGTRVLSNPKGYGPSLPRMPTIENPDFNPALVIEGSHG